MMRGGGALSAGGVTVMASGTNQRGALPGALPLPALGRGLFPKQMASCCLMSCAASKRSACVTRVKEGAFGDDELGDGEMWMRSR